MQVLSWDRGTVEYLSYTFTSVTDSQGLPVTPPASYDISAVLVGTYPISTDWQPAPWLAGPFAPGSYDIRIRFTSAPEIPVRLVARLDVR